MFLSVPPKPSQVGNWSYNATALGGGAFERWLNHDGSTLMNGSVLFIKGFVDANLLSCSLWHMLSCLSSFCHGKKALNRCGSLNCGTVRNNSLLFINVPSFRYSVKASQNGDQAAKIQDVCSENDERRMNGPHWVTVPSQHVLAQIIQ
jgi:hypothetical protein